VLETNIETNDTNITYTQDPIENHRMLSYTSMTRSEHEKNYNIWEMRFPTFHWTLAWLDHSVTHHCYKLDLGDKIGLQFSNSQSNGEV
jgi:hypothetical protein